MTSDYSDTQSKLISFKYGAANYMVKPIDLEELKARIWLQLSKSSEIKTTHHRILTTEYAIGYRLQNPLVN